MSNDQICYIVCLVFNNVWWSNCRFGKRNFSSFRMSNRMAGIWKSDCFPCYSGGQESDPCCTTKNFWITEWNKFEIGLLCAWLSLNTFISVPHPYSSPLQPCLKLDTEALHLPISSLTLLNIWSLRQILVRQVLEHILKLMINSVRPSALASTGHCQGVGYCIFHAWDIYNTKYRLSPWDNLLVCCVTHRIKSLVGHNYQ